MNIEYMTKVKENPKINNFVNRGFSEEKIQKIESKYNKGKKFPKAFREFLFLAGDFNNFGFDDIDGIIELQELAKEELEMAGQKVEKPFFAFDVYNSQYSVIFLDETKDDPKVYLISPFLAKGGEMPLIKPNGWEFTTLVNEHIHRVKNNIPF
ncbi:SMI1/KNR4 family protein [Chryseobacterium sp. HMWF035]|uniref:SMI1/KNR4 family protein n=1 Tax=Chryseobacterium sp. HMWF035 TaxID=2056868 RepID=UPI000D570394|nr:SMI1/KNR4 family protein [Chryseobacterium sp. HMWF035]PVV54225.1 hypothetical protein DD829_17690 [Chryseobacterium sp. HMWF035]